MECIILAGGMGTRLQRVVADRPKCMAPVNGSPFLHYMFDYLEQQECTRVILSLGYKHELVIEWLQTQNRPFTIDYVIEQKPLGTGGGIMLALHKATHEYVIVLNGDTMFRVNLTQLVKFHKSKHAVNTLALKRMTNFDRYGVVRLDENSRIVAFEEKKEYAEGLINGGVYVLNRNGLLKKEKPETFSLERDYFEATVAEGNMYGFECNEYFIDIGIPSDYEQAQKDFESF
ncbi:MAG: nucleotidyltransferase family protein [Chitinophagaceae bacterium]|nr:nucleotidyltransferase family protein [Chitinophagaceae bacterium]